MLPSREHETYVCYSALLVSFLFSQGNSITFCQQEAPLHLTNQMWTFRHTIEHKIRTREVPTANKWHVCVAWKNNECSRKMAEATTVIVTEEAKEEEEEKENRWPHISYTKSVFSLYKLQKNRYGFFRRCRNNRTLLPARFRRPTNTVVSPTWINFGIF